MRFATLFGLLLSQAISANGLKTLDPVGPHYPILVYEKSENPQNIMILYTKLDRDCHILPDESYKDRPTFDYYWLMDRQRYKHVNPLIRGEIQRRLQAEHGTASTFSVALNDLKELKTDLSDPHMHVAARKGTDGCEVEATLQLGPSDGGKTVRLTSIYSDTRKVGWPPPFRAINSVTVKGLDAKTGAELKRTYAAPP